MGKEANLKIKVFESIICDAREKHAETIDRAYEYFWDEINPDEFMKGTALSIGFMNFEDWLIFDYKMNKDKETFIDHYIKCNKEIPEEEITLLNKIKNSVLSLFEVVSVAKDKRIILKDILLDGKYELREKNLSKGLKKGDIFAARLLNLDKKHVMSGAVYPYTSDRKKKVLEFVDKQFKKYKKNANPDGTMKDYLKDYGDIFNIIWLNFILSSMQNMN